MALSLVKSDAPKPTSDEAVLARARKRFRIASDAESDMRLRQLADKRFAAGDQWSPKIKAQREADGDPCLVIDLLAAQIKQVKNQQRAMRPGIQVSAVDNGADEDTAEALEGLIRHIEQDSDADDAYDQAGDDQATIGRGWVRVLTEYADDQTGNLDAKIQRIRNPFSIYPDVAALRRDYMDGLYLFEVSDWIPEDLEARYPQAKGVSINDFEGLGDETGKWIQGEKIRVALYWEVTLNDRAKILSPGKTRTVTERTVTCYVLTGLKVLERYVWPGKYIPYAPILGEEVDIEGKVDLRGMVRRAKGPQEMYNYQKSKIAEVMALAPLAPFVVAEGQLGDYKKMWDQAGRKKFPYLVYKPTTLSGQPVAPPTRNFGEPPIQAMSAEALAAANEIRMATGFYDVAENSTPEVSGRAILARQQQGEHGNSDYLDGLSRGIRCVGRILVDLIPKIYDAPRIVRILGVDRQPSTVMVHASAPGAPAANALPPGVAGIFDLGMGRFDVTVDSGPSYASQRQAFDAMMTELLRSDPDLMKIAGDLYFENMDIPAGKQIAERLRKMLPAPLQSQDPADPAAAAAQAGQLQGMVQSLQAELAKAQQALQTDQVKTDAQVKMKAMDLDFQREKMQRDSETKIAVAELGAKVDRLALFMDERARLGMQAHEADQAAHARAHAVGLAAQGHAHGQAAADAAVARQPDDLQEAA